MQNPKEPFDVIPIQKNYDSKEVNFELRFTAGTTDFIIVPITAVDGQEGNLSQKIVAVRESKVRKIGDRKLYFWSKAPVK